MAEQNEAHFEVHSANKQRMYDIKKQQQQLTECFHTCNGNHYITSNQRNINCPSCATYRLFSEHFTNTDQPYNI